MEDLVVLLCGGGAILFAFCAALRREKRIRVIIPAVLLGVLAVYELHMIRWGKPL